MAFNVSKKDSQFDEYSSATEQASSSYLGKTLKVKGEITSDEMLTVEGEVKGNINITKTLTIGKDGYVDGEISAEVVKIDGKAKGNITATQKLEISSKGNFYGNIKSDKLVIAEGAVFQGKANMDE
jgi:cytoskeletal protein CcmA (bactofilin family)